MTVTSSLYCPKSILMSTSCYPPSRKRPATGSREAGKAIPVSAGKLRTIRSFYSRRRSSIIPILVASPSPPVRETKVQFSAEVSVHEIPSRLDYTAEEKQRIWTSKAELKKLIVKNHEEAGYEGRHWRNAPEEDEFTEDVNGKLVHPAHTVSAAKSHQPQQPKVFRRRPCLWQRKLPVLYSAQE